MSWILPPSASTFAGDIDFLYYVILVITGVAFVIVEFGLVWFIIKYRTRPGRKAYYTQGNMTAEIVWTAVPAVTLLILGVMSGRVWSDVKGRDSVPAGAIVFQVTAKQFEWNVTYAGPDGFLGTDDDFTLRNQLHVPVNQPIHVKLTSEDVIHSFFIPEFRVKQDVVPGMRNLQVWFQATETGQFEIACAELCGNGHTTMGARMTVHTQEDYERWLAERSAAAAED